MVSIVDSVETPFETEDPKVVEQRRRTGRKQAMSFLGFEGTKTLKHARTTGAEREDW
jgi:hypothetical protein